MKPARSETDSPQGTNMVALKWEGGKPWDGRNEGRKPKPQVTAVCENSSTHSLAPRRRSVTWRKGSFESLGVRS